MDEQYLVSLQNAIRSAHDCESRFIETVSVSERFDGGISWNGFVEVFELVQHPKAARCYAWGHSASNNGDELHYTVVLQIPPADSASKAVRTTIEGIISKS